MLILFINLLRTTIWMGVIQMLCRSESNNILQITANFGICSFRKNMVHMCCFIRHMSSFKMLCLPTTVLIVKQAEESFCFYGLIAVVCFVNFQRMYLSILFSCYILGLICIYIPKVIAIIHQCIIGDNMIR